MNAMRQIDAMILLLAEIENTPPQIYIASSANHHTECKDRGFYHMPSPNLLWQV